MATNKVREAISSIRAGDRNNGRRLLAEALRDDPKNELAWLWMSAVVSGDEQRFCLEKVLNINPENVQVQQKLAQLQASPTSPVAPINSLPSAAPTPVPQVNSEPKSRSQPLVKPVSRPVPENQNPQVWLIPGKNLSSIVYLWGDTLLTFDVLPDKASQVVSDARQGISAKQLDELKKKYHLLNVYHVALSKVKEVALFGDSIKINSLDNSGNEKRVRATADKVNGEAILTAIQHRLDPQFRKITRPISRATVMSSAVILFLLASCATGFFYWLARGLQGEGPVHGSAMARAIGNLVLLLGPNGVLCIGGVLFVVVVIAMISSLAKPPEETVLVRG